MYLLFIAQKEPKKVERRYTEKCFCLTLSITSMKKRAEEEERVERLLAMF